MIVALPPLAAEPIFHIGNFAVTNSYINSTITMVCFVVFAIVLNIAIRKSKGKTPRGIVNFFETILETLYQYFDTVTNSRAKSIAFMPFVGTLFLFILVSNWLSLLPGVGSIGRYLVHHGEVILVPMFRPGTSDLNLTLAMAVTSVVVSHFLGIAVIGFFRYANKFIKLWDIWHAVKTFKPVNLLTAVVEFFVGLLEIVSEVAKMLSLSLRLFGNVFAGEVLLTVLASILPVILPLPFIAMEMIVGIVQAAVFALLTLVYLTVAVSPLHSHDDPGNEHHQKGHDENTEHLESTPTF